MRDSTRRKIEREVDAGRLWRAKEIMQGNICHAGYDVELFEAYGRLLQTLGDELEAGKYLFLCGERRADYEHAIDLFLTRHGRSDPNQLFRSLPKSARHGNVDEYPPTVVAAFASLGLNPAKAAKESHTDHTAVSSVADTAKGMGCMLCIVVVVAVFIVGLTTIFDWF